LLGVRAAACIWRPLDEVLAGEPYAEIRQLSAGLLANGTGGPPYAITFGPPTSRLDGPSDRGATVERQMRLRRDGHDVAVMPAGQHTPQDLNTLLEEALVLFREGHREIDFVFAPEPDLPELELDREGVKRAVINILDNAIAACAARRAVAPGERGRVELQTTYVSRLGIVRLEIADNGDGMTAEVKARLFEPYFPTQPEGPGLGLAIVSAIVADHNGFIRARDNL